MQVSHPRDFVTQYKYRDHSFEDSLKPAPNQHRFLLCAQKEARVTADGRVIVKQKKVKPMEKYSVLGSTPMVNLTQTSTADPGSLEVESTFKSAKDSEKQIRKVHSQNLTREISNQIAAREPQFMPWKPGHARCEYFDKTEFKSVIYPQRFEQVPRRDFGPKYLHKEGSERTFYKHVASTKGPFYKLKNNEYYEKPPRTFYNHIKADFDFFGGQSEKRRAPKQMVVQQRHQSFKETVHQDLQNNSKAFSKVRTKTPDTCAPSQSRFGTPSIVNQFKRTLKSSKLNTLEREHAN